LGASPLFRCYLPRLRAKSRLTELAVRKLKGKLGGAFMVWDAHTRGLGLKVMPTGAKSWKFLYSRHGRSRWLHIGAVGAIDLAGARELAAEAALAVARGKDPAADRAAARATGTFADLAARYRETYAKRHNRSWAQADTLVRRRLLPMWGKLQASSITRSDVRALMARIDAPITANQTLAAASAIFSWAMKQELIAGNPCIGIERNPTRSRERVLSDSEIPRFWAAFDDVGLVAGTACKIILLLGQRPGEVAHMRFEHLIDGWWQMPGAPDPAIGWLGTKNSEKSSGLDTGASARAFGRALRRRCATRSGFRVSQRTPRPINWQSRWRHARGMPSTRRRARDPARSAPDPRHDGHVPRLWARGHEQNSKPS
jgi:integrase